MSAIRKAISIVGVKAIADEFGISQAAVYKWGDEIPIERCPGIERLTGGKVTRRDLRPNDWQEIWPELVGMTPCSGMSQVAGSSSSGQANADQSLRAS